MLSQVNSEIQTKRNLAKTKNKIYVVIGTRAQLVKMAPLMALMQKEGTEYEFIYTAQHKETINKILQDFHVKQPDKTIYTKSEANTLSKFMGWAVTMFFKLFRPKKIFPEKGIVLIVTMQPDPNNNQVVAMFGKTIVGENVGRNFRGKKKII